MGVTIVVPVVGVARVIQRQPATPRPIRRIGVGPIDAMPRTHQFVPMVIRTHPPGKYQLAMVVHAGDGLGLHLGLAQCGEEHAGQNGNDGDHHQQLNQGKTGGEGIPPLAENVE